MELTPGTKIGDLLNQYSFLTEYMKQQSPKYALLDSPLARKTLGSVATLSQVSRVGGLDVNSLMAGIATEIREKTGDTVTVAGGEAGEGRLAGPSGGEEALTGGVAAGKATSPLQQAASYSQEQDRMRQETLKGIIRDLHAGVEMDDLKQRFAELIRDIDPGEIAKMEQALIEEGMPETEIKRLCDVHVQVFKESLGKKSAISAPAGHPVHTFMQENRAAEEIMREILEITERLCGPENGDALAPQRERLAELLEDLSRIDLHYLRKENQLFPALEAQGIKGPTQVMWAIHDDIRATLKTARAELAGAAPEEALNTITYAVKSISDMIYKEENILFPMSMEKLSGADWQRVREGEEQIGYAWIAPDLAAPEAAGAEAAAVEAAGTGAGAVGLLSLETGQLSLEQVDLLLRHLPVELSFVDENDEVRYYSGLPHKIFPRSPGVIGRKVQNCHPPGSVHIVQRILDEFRAGTRDMADFWIEKDCRFIHISYVAVRDGARAYRGTLEVVQDATGVRSLTGQRRLLDWDEAPDETASTEGEPPPGEQLPEQPGF